MENMESCKGGVCGTHMCSSHMRHVVIKIVVAVLIFWCGVQFGELKSLLHEGRYDRGMMSSYNARVYQDGATVEPMMGGWVTTQAPAATTSKK